MRAQLIAAPLLLAALVAPACVLADGVPETDAERAAPAAARAPVASAASAQPVAAASSAAARSTATAASVAPAAPSAPAATVASSGSTAKHYSITETEVGVLLDDPRARAILDRHIPGFSVRPKINMARPFTMTFIQGFEEAGITEAMLAAIQADFDALAQAPQ